MGFYYRTAGELAELAQRCKKKDLEPEDLVREACKVHQIQDLGLLTDLNEISIDIDRKRFSVEREVAQRLFDAQVYVDLMHKNPVHICGKILRNRLTQVVALNLLFAEDAFMLAKCV